MKKKLEVFINILTLLLLVMFPTAVLMMRFNTILSVAFLGIGFLTAIIGNILYGIEKEG